MKFFLLMVTIGSVLLTAVKIQAQTAKVLAAAWEKNHITTLPPSEVRLQELKVYLEKLKMLGLPVEEVGRSYEDREIFQIEWGRGKTKVFLWSQMHGNEPTATSALIDMFAFLQKNRSLGWVRELERNLTIRAVPMLNPDGAERYRRTNAQGIDINRDARALETPEGRLLKHLRDEFEPDIGFNLHNQRELTTVGRTTDQATFSLLAVGGDPELDPHPQFERNKRISALIFQALSQFVPGHVARYDDDYTATAFGDNFSDWGTPVILIETGGHQGHEQSFVVKLNFVAFLTALNSLVDGSEKKIDLGLYDAIPENGGGRLFNVIFRNASVIKLLEPKKEEPVENSEPDGEQEPVEKIPAPEKSPEPEKPAEFAEPVPAEVAVNTDRDRTGRIRSAYIERIGDLKYFKGLEEIDVSGFYLVSKSGRMENGFSGEFLFYKKGRKIDWRDPEFPKKTAPDAVWSNGRWIKPPGNR
ncbi:MAG: M14 family zinc carboxypeptidase [Pyrinomonadaceae bacterium]